MGRFISLIARAGRIAGYDPGRPNQSQNQQLGQHLLRLFELLQINCVIDVGANQGQYGRFLRAIGYRGNIISFEPSGDDYDLLSRLAEKDPRWSTHQLALVDSDQLA
jgi:hypothetical protein